MEEMKRKYKAILIGGTGAVGEKVVKILLESEKFQKVTNVGRKLYESLPKEVNQVQVEMEKLEESETLKNELKEKYDVAFLCLGTTKSDAGGAEQFRKIDFGYNTTFAKICKENQVKHVSLVSSTGADSKSWFLYLQVKGDIENYVKELSFSSFSIFRPGLIGRGDKMRTGEKFFAFLTKAIQAETIAKAMVNVAIKRIEGEENSEPQIFHNKEIWEQEKEYNQRQK